MKATDILPGLGRTYAAAAAYRDVGRVIFPHRGATIGEFRTAFIRSKGFRFEYRETSSSGQMRDRSSRRTCSIRVERGRLVDVSGFESSRESIGLAVASMTGITFGAAHNVLRLLLPNEIPGRALSEAPSAGLVRTFIVEGDTCFAMRLKEWSAEEIIVDEEFVLRRVDGVGRSISRRPTTGVGESRLSQVLVYEPELFAKEPRDLTLDW